MSDHFAELVLPLRVRSNFTYLIPTHLEQKVQPGIRVWVMFGHRLLLGWVWACSSTGPKKGTPKKILSVLDESPLLTPTTRAFYEWMAEYYMVSLGELIKVAVPSALHQLRGYVFHLEVDQAPEPLLKAFAHRKRASASISVSSLLGSSELSAQQIATWLETGLLSLLRSTSQSAPLPEWVQMPDHLPASELSLSRSAQQRALWHRFLSIQDTSKRSKVSELAPDARRKRSLRQLLAKGYLVAAPPAPSQKSLATKEGSSFLSFLQSSSDPRPLLCGLRVEEELEACVSWVMEAHQAGRSILWLLPTEAALDERRKALAPYLKEISYWYSGMPKAEQLRCWKEVAQGHQRLVLALRGGIFLPYPHLDILLIEEDMQDQLKESHRGLRYHGRDAALMSAQLRGARSYIFSRTPALESLHKAWQGVYQHHAFPDPEGLPSLSLYPPGRLFSDRLSETLDKGLQLLLFHPHKGYGRYLRCTHCEEVPRCPSCGLAYRYQKERLCCSSCQQSLRSTSSCPSCQSQSWKIEGEGTDQLAERMQLSFPDHTIGRWEGTSDQQKTREALRTAFFRQEISILLATEHMLYDWKEKWKGTVMLWGCEGWLYRPHYRADEHFMQWITSLRYQLKDQGLRLELHTNTQKAYKLLSQLFKDGYEAFARAEATKRHSFRYPPYLRLVSLRSSHSTPSVIRSHQQSFQLWVHQHLPLAQLQSAPLLWHPQSKSYTQRLLLRLPPSEQVTYKRALLEWTHQQSRSINFSFEVDF